MLLLYFEKDELIFYMWIRFGRDPRGEFDQRGGERYRDPPPPAGPRDPFTRPDPRENRCDSVQWTVFVQSPLIYSNSPTIKGMFQNPWLYVKICEVVTVLKVQSD